MLLTQNLTLYRSKRKIFENVNMSLSSGKIILLKGKNGSGKTSLIKTILNILEPSTGSIYWKGKILKKNLYDYYKNITYISDKISTIRQLSVNENITIWKKIFLSNISNQEINNILSLLNIDKFFNSKVSTLSLGETKKLELLRLIIENKKIWILDEPFTNLDLESVDVLEHTFTDHCNKNGSVLFSTHNDTKLNISEEIIL